MFDEAFLRKLERLALLTRRAAAGQLQGERRSSKRGQSVEFSDFRPYVTGDDFRRIDWNAYARLERFFIKLFVEEQELTVHLLIDASKSMDWGEPNKLDFALHAAGALGFIVLCGLDRVTATALGDPQRVSGATNGANRLLSPIRGKRQASSLFSFLQSVSPPLPAPTRFSSGRGSARQLLAYAASATQTGPLLLFSDLMDDGWMDGVNSLAARGFEVTVLHILSPDELNPDISGDFLLIDSERHPERSEGSQEIEITADFETLDRYQQTLMAWRDTWRHFCNQRGAHYVPIDTSVPLEELLFAWLRNQGVLR